MIVPLKIWMLSFIFQIFITKSRCQGFKCKYGERGALTAICENATPSSFRNPEYHFDHLDETLLCLNCTLTELTAGRFDIGGNRIQILNLTNSKIETIEAKTFTGLVFLEKLYLSHNIISKFETEVFYGTRKVKELYLDDALLAPLPDYVFRELRQLRKLILKGNSGLDRLGNLTFFGLIHLQFLDMSWNKLKELNGSVANLENLEVLLLNDNKLQTILPTDFLELSKLVELDLSNNRITVLRLFFPRQNILRYLNLMNNNLTDDVVESYMFQHLTNLETLDLSRNSLTTIPLRLFHLLYNLRELTLSENNITKFAFSSFTGLPSLQSLNLSHNSIKETNFVNGTFQLNHVSKVDFSHNKIKELDEIFLKFRFPLLFLIRLEDNLIPCASRRRLELILKKLYNTVTSIDVDNCPKLDEKEEKDVLLEVNGELNVIAARMRSIDIIKIWFLIVILILVGVLFYIQFFILNRRQPE
ncbi:hypothetical protein ABEB36_006404 [Hypothenemus hampei]|uniref:Uncharacterized protein n=1 Tax=Hypothenemus hampei TaxID=57062 RepID=A0ABD1ESN1_HYPHA